MSPEDSTIISLECDVAILRQAIYHVLQSDGKLSANSRKVLETALRTTDEADVSAELETDGMHEDETPHPPKETP